MTGEGRRVFPIFNGRDVKRVDVCARTGGTRRFGCSIREKDMESITGCSTLCVCTMSEVEKGTLPLFYLLPVLLCSAMACEHVIC